MMMQQQEEGAPSVSSHSDSEFGKTPISQEPPEIRSGFIQKVYSLLCIQLAVTFGICLYINAHLSKEWVKAHISLYFVALGVAMATLIGTSCCCTRATRTFPTNYIFLGVITLSMSVMVGFVTVFYTTESVLMALAAAVGVFLILTAFACITKTDFTGLGPYLFAGLCTLSLFSFVMFLWSAITGHPLVGSWVHKAYAVLGLILFVFYIIYDTQKIVGGQHKNQFSVDDYVVATLDLYLDFVNLFLFLLEILGDRD
uniref:Uncharacterized protein n=1 Tax=Alexandrium monilatum TaxID=311494 RepID=A0A7S4RUT9_9DINO|mmetsp:Transcript_74812/g.223059  ORF Transcript_74812/g.223059 Transcript_74812/m.223059 type:complete len:256 (-) Transcript_74812:80-847(-)